MWYEISFSFFEHDLPFSQIIQAYFTKLSVGILTMQDANEDMMILRFECLFSCRP